MVPYIEITSQSPPTLTANRTERILILAWGPPLRSQRCGCCSRHAKRMACEQVGGHGRATAFTWKCSCTKWAQPVLTTELELAKEIFTGTYPTFPVFAHPLSSLRPTRATRQRGSAAWEFHSLRAHAHCAKLLTWRAQLKRASMISGSSSTPVLNTARLSMAELQVEDAIRDESKSSPSPELSSPVQRASWAIASTLAPQALERRAQAIQDNAQLDVFVDTRQEHNSGVEHFGPQGVYERVRRKSKDLLERIAEATAVSPVRQERRLWRRQNSKENLTTLASEHSAAETTEATAAAQTSKAAAAGTGLEIAMAEVAGSPSSFGFAALSGNAALDSSQHRAARGAHMEVDHVIVQQPAAAASESDIESALADTQDRATARLGRASSSVDGSFNDSPNGSFNAATGSFHTSSKPATRCGDNLLHRPGRPLPPARRCPPGPLPCPALPPTLPPALPQALLPAARLRDTRVTHAWPDPDSPPRT